MSEKQDSDRLRSALEDTLGVEASTLLMDRLPRTDDPAPATREDVAGVRTEVLEVRRDLDGVLAQLRQEITSLRSGTAHEFTLVRTEIRETHYEMLACVRGEMIAAITTQTRTLLFGLVGVLLAVIPLALVLAQLT